MKSFTINLKVKKKQKKNKIKRTSVITENSEGIHPAKKKKKTKLKTVGTKKEDKSANSKNIILNENKNINIDVDNPNIKKPESVNNKPDTDYELNWLSYEEALKYDKRTKCDYYGALIRTKQLFIFTFCSFNDYNSGVIKKFMFFLSFALHYTVNALFFDEKNMHQIYEDKGKYNFGYQAPYILGSAVISTLALRLMLQFLVLTDKDILQVKLQTTKNMAINMKIQKLKCMKIKFAIFFVLNFILLGLFWFYLTSFNAIYENTQVYLIENTFISFGFSLVYPFIINIIPMMIRMNAIHSSNKDQANCYKVSQILQLI